ncbi:MAG: DUF1127 domain-containing protein [Bradyrhizobium sp.]|nr:DUF1127 domain-containing protein [Bradyrhizobium sp.]
MLVTVWRENMRDRHRLAVMGDRELQDIGLSRTEVADEIRRSFWREMNGRLP